MAFEEDPEDDYIASSSSCVFNTRPTYGFIRLNVAKFLPDPTPTPSKFHHSVMILVFYPLTQIH